MKKIYLFVTTALLLTSCQKDEITPALEEVAATPKALQEINFTDLPDDVLSNFDNKKFVYYKGTKSKNMFGPARTDVPAVKNINKKGRVSYTIVLKKVDENKSADALYFDNLYIQETEEGEQRMCVIRYIPEDSWYYQKDKDLKNFSGRIELYDLQGKSLGKSTVFEGKPVQNKATLAVTECLYEFSATLCVGDVHNPESYSCTFKYSLKSCSTTLYGDSSPSGTVSSSTYEGSTWNIGYGEDGSVVNGSGGDGNNDDEDDDIETTPLLPLEPIVDEDTVKIENELDDPCAFNIFQNLRTGPLVDHPLSPEVQIPENEPYNLATKVLALFNNHRSVNHTVGDDIGGNRTFANQGHVYTFLNESYINNATSLSIARTLIHEGLHAYLLLENSSYQSTLFGALEAYARENGYVDANTIHHNFMGSYVDAMAYSLYKWDATYGTGGLRNSSGQIDAAYYRAMAFGGFYTFNNGIRTDYDSFRALVPNQIDRDNIVKIIQNEQDGNTDSRGKDC